MGERAFAILRVSAAVIAVVVIVVGLWPRSEPVTGPAERADALAANIKCPFCSGESLFDSTSGVARDYRSLIDELIEEGKTDDEIFDAFVARFGASILLDPSGSGWGVLLWVIPGLVAAAGVVAVLGLRRRATVERNRATVEVS